MGMITCQQTEGKSLEELRTLCNESPSRLVRIFGESIPELVSLEGDGFINRLRKEDFALEFTDIDQVHHVAMAGLDRELKQKYPNNTIRTKLYGLPSMIFYENFSKVLRDDKALADVLWVNAGLMDTGGRSFYANPERILEVSRANPEIFEHGLIALALMSDKAFQSGRVSYNWRVIHSQREAQQIISSEYQRLFREFAEQANHKASSILQGSFVIGKEANALADSFGAKSGALGDWLQDVRSLDNFTYTIRKYAPRAGLEVN